MKDHAENRYWHLTPRELLWLRQVMAAGHYPKQNTFPNDVRDSLSSRKFIQIRYLPSGKKPGWRITGFGRQALQLHAWRKKKDQSSKRPS